MINEFKRHFVHKLIAKNEPITFKNLFEIVKKQSKRKFGTEISKPTLSQIVHELDEANLVKKEEINKQVYQLTTQFDDPVDLKKIKKDMNKTLSELHHDVMMGIKFLNTDTSTDDFTFVYVLFKWQKMIYNLQTSLEMFRYAFKTKLLINQENKVTKLKNLLLNIILLKIKSNPNKLFYLYNNLVINENESDDDSLIRFYETLDMKKLLKS